ncbi:tripartite motif-containing protein 35-like [Cottoperca gobio]|uniref:Tripartite motif-containing protein 35-like n=1 Tax=Cottoperca gobio TaxID=56716 RepID=A0A6J2Q9L2_COTGO|nr:tripartite motif-containing protein 35-like [Cottoperca gobio]
METTSGLSMSCQSFLPVSLHRAEAEGLASTPSSVDCPERCEEHEESMSMFCLDDLEPLCEQCAAVRHTGHRVYLLTDAAADCKEELRTSLNGLKNKRIHFEKVTQSCGHASRHNQAESKLTEEHMKKEFESLHQFLREEEAARLLALWGEQQEKKKEAEEQIHKMNQMIKSLEDKIQLVEEELDVGGDGVGFLKQYQDTMNSTWGDDREPQKVCRPLIDVAKHLGNLQYAEWEKMKHIAPYTPVTLDPRTAGQSLKVSPGLNSVHITPGPSQGLSVPVPANKEGFHPYSCILAREGFDSGVHCWDIEVGDTNNWTVGVAAQSVSRAAEFEACPETGLWCISLREDKYMALTAPAQNLNSDHFSRLRVRLDWDEGTLEFMNTDTETHLFTFRHRFDEKVYPCFESMSSSGGFAVLAQRVKVSMGSDYVPGEDTAITEVDITAASTKSSGKMSECRTEDKHSAGKEKTKDNKPAVKTQSSKPRFSVAYHVSLNRARNITNNESDNHKQIRMNHVDHMVNHPCVN